MTARCGWRSISSCRPGATKSAGVRRPTAWPPGNTVLEATLHGLYEVIERDAAAQRSFRRRFGEGDCAWALRVSGPRRVAPPRAGVD